MMIKDLRCINLLLRVLPQLFSASAVIETRAAAQLGENVRLLAYVSIFYLPLAFCTVSCTYSLASTLYVVIIRD